MPGCQWRGGCGGHNLLLLTHHPTLPSLVQPGASPQGLGTRHTASPARATRGSCPDTPASNTHPPPQASAGQHVIKSLPWPLALAQAAFSHYSEQEGWKLSDLLKTAVAQC